MVPGRSCASCGAGLPGRYCCACGERAIEPGDLALGRVLGDWLDASFNLNGRLLLTARKLLFSPGFLTAEWCAGRRKAYSTPVSIHLFAYFLFGLVLLVIPAYLVLGSVLMHLGQGGRWVNELLNREPALAAVLVALLWTYLYLGQRRVYADQKGPAAARAAVVVAAVLALMLTFGKALFFTTFWSL